MIKNADQNLSSGSKWLTGFPISESSTVQTDVPKWTGKKVAPAAPIFGETICAIAPAHVVQVECLVETINISSFSNIQALTSYAAQLQVVDDALKRVYELERQSRGRIAARKLMIFIEFNFKKKNITLTSKLLEKVDLASLGIHSLIGLTRSTLRARSRLPVWDDVYRRSRKAVQDRGYSVDELFIGMPEIEESSKDGRVKKV